MDVSTPAPEIQMGHVSGQVFPASLACAKACGLPCLIELNPFIGCDPISVPAASRPRITFLIDGNLRDDLRELYRTSFETALSLTAPDTEIAFITFSDAVQLLDMTNLEADTCSSVAAFKGVVTDLRLFRLGVSHTF